MNGLIYLLDLDGTIVDSDRLGQENSPRESLKKQ
jgi:hypothetical protein